jgi:anti-anti-sigma factor
MSLPQIIAPSGELDITASRRLGPLLNGAAGAPAGDLIIDLSDVSFIDSTGLGAILQTHQRFARQGRVVSLVAPKGSAAAVLLDLSGLRTPLPVFDSRADALSAAAA